MNRTTRLIGIGVLVATCALAFAAADAVNLKFGRKVGDTAKYKTTMKMSLGGSEAVVTFDVVDKITKVGDEGYSIESNQSNVRVEFAGGSQTEKDSTETSSYKANGEVLSVETSQPNPMSMRLANLQNFVFPGKPVNVGDEWTSTVTGDEKFGVVAATATYKFEAIEKVGSRDTAKVKVSYKETAGDSPATSEATWWMNVADGSLVKVNADMKNVPTPMAGLLADGTINVERVD